MQVPLRFQLQQEVLIKVADWVAIGVATVIASLELRS